MSRRQQYHLPIGLHSFGRRRTRSRRVRRRRSRRNSVGHDAISRGQQTRSFDVHSLNEYTNGYRLHAVLG